MKTGEWSAADEFIFRELYPATANAEIAELLDRSLSSVSNKAVKLGLRKSAKYMARKPGCFQPGHGTWNKGKPHPARGRSKQTQFKPGRPASEARNYRPVGTERVTKDGVLERKTTDDPSLVPAQRWVAVGRIAWEAVNGPLPAGHVVVFKPGRKTTDASLITDDSVELVTRAELMRRNSYHNKYPKEVAQLIQLRGALNRKINSRSKEA